jgi:hypothetical protein
MPPERKPRSMMLGLKQRDRPTKATTFCEGLNSFAALVEKVVWTTLLSPFTLAGLLMFPHVAVL